MDDQETTWGYEATEKPESALYPGGIEMTVTAMWIQQETKKGNTSERRGATYRTPYGKEAPVFVPYDENIRPPEGMITLPQLEKAFRQLLAMKDYTFKEE